jgi:hypothetical protein
MNKVEPYSPRRPALPPGPWLHPHARKHVIVRGLPTQCPLPAVQQLFSEYAYICTRPDLTLYHPHTSVTWCGHYRPTILKMAHTTLEQPHTNHTTHANPTKHTNTRTQMTTQTWTLDFLSAYDAELFRSAYQNFTYHGYRLEVD